MEGKRRDKWKLLENLKLGDFFRSNLKGYQFLRCNEFCVTYISF